MLFAHEELKRQYSTHASVVSKKDAAKRDRPEPKLIGHAEANMWEWVNAVTATYVVHTASSHRICVTVSEQDQLLNFL